MTPSVDLLLATLGRALEVTILPAAGNAAAREEASLGVLFVRWLRDVVDHAVDAERASHADCRAALADVAALLEAGSPGAAGADVAAEARRLRQRPPPDDVATLRDELRRAKALLASALRASRAGGDSTTAAAVRRRLLDLAGREIERERAFGRATGMDPDAASLGTLAGVLERGSERRS